MKTRLRNLGIVIGGAAYLWFSYIVATDPSPSWLAVLFSLTLFIAAAVVSIWKSRFRAPLLLLLVAALTLLALNVDRLYGHLAWLFFFQHAGAMTLLAIIFGSTLRAGDAAALCSRVAIMIIPVELDAAYLRYTRNVTVAWTGYFACCAVLSVILFFFASIQVWGVFSQFITPITIGAMFVGEYLIRKQVLPNGPKISIATIVQAYRRMG